MDPFLVTILVLLVLASLLGAIQARKTDKCLHDAKGFHVTLVETDGDLCWGEARIFTTGIEISYNEPVDTPEGHRECSFVFYKEQYDAMDALYRYPEGLSENEQERRRKIIQRTAHPGPGRRLARKVQNWVGMIRDSLMRAITMVIGAAKTKAPGATVLNGQEKQLQALSNEVIGHVGNAYDPLLEHHLFSEVVVEVTRQGKTQSYCGWLKDYTSRFLEVVDVDTQMRNKTLELTPFPEAEGEDFGIKISTMAHQFKIANNGKAMLHVSHLATDGWRRTMNCVLPPGAHADVVVPDEVSVEQVCAWVSSVEKVDMIVPRSHALVRHGAISKSKKDKRD